MGAYEMDASFDPFIEIVNNIGTIKNNENSFNLSLYPNPANKYCTITFTIPKAENCRIEVVDISGQRIKTIYNEFKNPGIYHILWNVSDYTSGIYFCKLLIDNQNPIVQKIIIN